KAQKETEATLRKEGAELAAKANKRVNEKEAIIKTKTTALTKLQAKLDQKEKELETQNKSNGDHKVRFENLRKDKEQLAKAKSEIDVLLKQKSEELTAKSLIGQKQLN